ncbi:unnamed protein product [Mucor fragilis]
MNLSLFQVNSRTQQFDSVDSIRSKAPEEEASHLKLTEKRKKIGRPCLIADCTHQSTDISGASFQTKTIFLPVQLDVYHLKPPSKSNLMPLIEFSLTTTYAEE